MNHRPIAIAWLRDDLRVADNPALAAAVAHGGEVIVVVVRDEHSPETRALGGAARWWWHHSLSALAREIEARGGRLTLRTGPARDIIPALAAESGAGLVTWNRRYGRSRAIDADLKAHLRARGIAVTSHAAALLHEPWEVATGSGGAFQVFTPYWRAASSLDVREPLPAPRRIPAPAHPPASESLDSWRLLPTDPDWAEGLRNHWRPGEAGAHERLGSFLADGLALYHRRDEPATPATSRLSPHLRFGEISPHQIWAALHEPLPESARANVAKFASEIGWREFSYNLLYHRPTIDRENVRPGWDAFPWRTPSRGDATWRAWRRGTTGVPLVDAGMRELWHTGWMHNRVRMVAASFLVKNLLIDWRAGEEWFWDTLVDADEANNPASWQWVAGSGADAAPYFRVFNPELQRTKFDPDGEYVARWVPEWGTPAYPDPVVDARESREAALAAYASLTSG